MKKLFSILAIVFIAIILLTVNIPYLGVILGTAGALIFAAVNGGISTLGFKKPTIGFAKTAAIALGMACVILMATYLLMLPAIELVTGQSLQLGVFSDLEGNISALLFSLTVGWIIGGFSEEILFRGFMLSRIKKLVKGKAGKILAVIATSVFFGYLHSYQGITGQILVGFIGLLLGGFFVMNKQNIWLNIFLHGFLNTGSFTLLYLGWINL